LVLTDVWYPGWTCTIDGQPAPLHRANFLFRAVAIPAGEHEVVFTFAPVSYRWGQRITMAALALVVGLVFLALARRLIHRKVGFRSAKAEVRRTLVHSGVRRTFTE